MLLASSADMPIAPKWLWPLKGARGKKILFEKQKKKDRRTVKKNQQK